MGCAVLLLPDTAASLQHYKPGSSEAKTCVVEKYLERCRSIHICASNAMPGGPIPSALRRHFTRSCCSTSLRLTSRAAWELLGCCRACDHTSGSPWHRMPTGGLQRHKIAVVEGERLRNRAQAFESEHWKQKCPLSLQECCLVPLLGCNICKARSDWLIECVYFIVQIHLHCKYIISTRNEAGKIRK